MKGHFFRDNRVFTTSQFPFEFPVMTKKSNLNTTPNKRFFFTGESGSRTNGKNGCIFIMPCKMAALKKAIFKDCVEMATTQKT
jgi:hypothetical protein